MGTGRRRRRARWGSCWRTSKEPLNGYTKRREFIAPEHCEREDDCGEGEGEDEAAKIVAHKNHFPVAISACIVIRTHTHTYTH